MSPLSCYRRANRPTSNLMKRRSGRDIPDFAPKRPHNQALDKLAKNKPVVPAQRQQVVKPQATSRKSGQRGQ